MRILMVNSFNYLRGGAERCCFDLSALLEANGHQVIPFSMRHPRNVPSPYADYFVASQEVAAYFEAVTAESLRARTGRPSRTSG